MTPGQTLWDSEIPGFGIRYRVKTKTFFMVYRPRSGGAQRRFTIGKYGAFTLDDARRQALITGGMVAGDADPQEQRRRSRDQPNIEILAARFVTEHVTPKLRPATAVEYKRLLEKRIVPKFGAMRADRLTETDVARWHATLAHIPREANQAAAVLSRLMSFAEQRGARAKASNPVRGLERYRETSRERFLSRDEFARLGSALKAAEAQGVNPFAVAAILLLILTGARRGEIRSLRWEHVDLERRALFLTESKTGKKTIHLNDQAVRILERLPRMAGNPHCFPSGRADHGDKGRSVGQHMKDLMTPWRHIRNAAAIPDVRLHDLRHSFASVAASEGVPLATLGRLVGHSTLRTTERYAHIFNASARAANDQIGDHLAKALTPPARKCAGATPSRIRLRRVSRLVTKLGA
jgi:integrase